MTNLANDIISQVLADTWHFLAIWTLGCFALLWLGHKTLTMIADSWQAESRELYTKSEIEQMEEL